MKELSQPIKHLIQKYQEWQKTLQSPENIATIHVDEVASRMASFYEKIRGVIDWREEHLLRKTAIERILKRRLFLRKDGRAISEPFVYELIRGGHFPNDLIPETKIEEIQRLIDKYIFILNNAPPSAGKKQKMKLQFYDWILGIAACEVEEILAPPLPEIALMEFMLELMQERIEISGRALVAKKMPEEERITQIYIAIQRTLFNLDPPLISYNLLKKWYPQWSNLSQESLKETSDNIYMIWDRLEKNLNHPLAEKFYKICERYNTPYLILSDILAGDPIKANENLGSPEVLEGKIRDAYDKRLRKSKEKMKRAALYSSISILLSKMMVAFIVEVPFDVYLTNQFSYLTLGLNVLIPSSLMFFLVLAIKPPSKQNAELAMMEVMKIVYVRERKEVYEIRPSPKRGLILNLIIGVFYLLSFAASFGIIIWGLQELNFSILSIAIFLMFISLISFAGIKIRQRAKELVIEREKETFLHTLLDIFSLPFIQVGRWLSRQLVKYNILVVLFTFLLDMPFQLFVEFLEQWRAFLQEKKEKIN